MDTKDTYEAVIGLEVHAELDTESKMFCACKNDPFNSSPNTNICPVCMGMPGTLPVPNKKAIEMVVMCGLALNAKIADFSKWDRKNYYYPDLPKGYQISQYDIPLTEAGYVNIDSKKIGITRIHLEEDTGKLVHPKGENYSLVDYNRAGVPLMELVTEPDIRTGFQAKQFGMELQKILRSLKLSKADMEKGQMRVEVNISVRKKDVEKFGTKVEIKNLNSFRAVERSVDFEIERQIELIEEGGKVKQETRGWNEDKGITFSQREKETAMDYRYFPEPDLMPVEWDKKKIEEIKSQMPELPEAKRKRYAEDMGLGGAAIDILVGQNDLADYFEKILLSSKDLNPAKVANWLVHEQIDLSVKVEFFAELLNLVDRKEISATMGKEILQLMNETKESPAKIIEEKGMKKVSGEGELGEIVARVIDSNPKAVEDYKNGKEAALGFLLGQLMRETRGQADPATSKEVLLKYLAK